MNKPVLHRKEGIVISAIEVMNEVGIQGLSTREIARHVGISEGALFRHFKSKADILLGVLDHFSQYDNDIIQTCKSKQLNPIETIRYFVSSYYEYYENYPAITVILQLYDCFMFEKELSENVKEIITKRTNFLIETIKLAQSQEQLNDKIDAEDLADLIIGGSRNICLRWRMEKYNFKLKEKVMSMLEIALNSARRQSI